jgi:hypothetical protein
LSHLGEDLDKLGLLERREQILSRRHKEAKAKREAWEREVYDRMIGEGWRPNDSGVNRNGIKFRPKSTTFAVVQDADKLREWLQNDEEDELADAGLVEDKFKKGDLNRIARTKLDNGEPLPPGMGSYDKTMISKSGILATTQEDEDDGEQ